MLVVGEAGSGLVVKRLLLLEGFALKYLLLKSHRQETLAPETLDQEGFG